MRVLTPQQMRDADAAAVRAVGDVALMRAAGARIAGIVMQYASEGRIVAFAGPGNNGGDAFAALACLPSCDGVVYAEPAEHPSPARTDAERRARIAGVRVLPLPANAQEARDALAGANAVLDGLLGMGARLPLPPQYAPAVEAMNACGAPTIAIDVPSGIDAESGSVSEIAVRATATVTLGALKRGLLLNPARAHAGDVWLADIGMPAQTLDALDVHCFALDDDEFLKLLPRRAGASDKRAAGAPLIVAGSEQFPGAAVLCAMGAARAGAGYVTVATAKSAAPVLRAHLIEQVVVTIDPAADATQAIDDLLDVAQRCSSVAMGPGLGLDDRTGEVVRGFAQRCELPMVLDAGALFHFAKSLDLLRDKRAVLTPHAGEFARLSGKGTVKEGERAERLREFVARTGITTLLKGEATLIDDGTNLHVNTTGTNALATAGTGDVLSGIIATLLSQGLLPVDAARVGAYWHGLAGRHASEVRSRGVIARDVYDALADAVTETCRRNERSADRACRRITG